MTRLRLFTDEDVYGAVAERLRLQGFDAVSTPETHRLGETDPRQLEWASEQGRAIVTFNVRHFAALHEEWLARGQRHAGIILSHQHPIGDLIRRLAQLARMLSAEEMQDRLEFLNNWCPP